MANGEIQENRLRDIKDRERERGKFICLGNKLEIMILLAPYGKL